MAGYKFYFYFSGMLALKIVLTFTKALKFISLSRRNGKEEHKERQAPNVCIYSEQETFL